jgi:glutathione S-transferase
MPTPPETAKEPWRLYAAEFSLYSGKARAYMDFKDIPYREVLSSRVVIRDVLHPATGMKMIPVVQSPDGEFIQDTTAIIDHLEARFPAPSIYPADPVQRLVSLLFEVLADEWLLLPAMHYRWHYKRQNLRFILGEFGELVEPRAPAALRPLVGAPLALVFGGLYKDVLGVSKTNFPAIEAWYEEVLGQLNAHFRTHRFLLGDRPSIGDFGLIAPLYAHLYRDPYPGEIMRRVAPHVADWVRRMRHPAPATGEFGDVAPTLLPILRRMFAEYVPVALDTMTRGAAWLEANPEAERFPRFIGRHTFRIGGVEETRRVTPYTQWMWQRPLQWYQQLEGPDRSRADALLEQIEGHAAMQVLPSRWVHRVKNRIAPCAAPPSLDVATAPSA